MAEQEVEETLCFSMAVAEKAFLDGDFETALKHFFACMVMLPTDRRSTYEDQFAAAVHGWIALNPENAGRAISLYPQIRTLFPTTTRTKMSLIRAIQATGQTRWLLNCLPICKDCEDLTDKDEDLIALRIIRVNLTTQPFPQWHIRMINDVGRNEAFAKALSSSIKSRSTVVFDIGSGTGLLSVMAAKQTNLVVALEENVSSAMISREVIKRNGVEGRVTVHSKNSLDFQTSQKADVVVSETMDCCFFGEHCVELFVDAHQRFAHEKTIFIPNKATVYIRLFSCREIFDIHCQDYGGVRYRSEYVRINDTDPPQPYWCANTADFPDFVFISQPEAIRTVDFTSLEDLKNNLTASGELKLLSPLGGVAHGFAVHFIADLTGHGTTINSADMNAWDLGIFPFKEPCVVQGGDELDVSWKLSDGRLDIINEFYPEELKNADECERLFIRYESTSLEQIQRLRDDTTFKLMMSEVGEKNYPRLLDVSSLIAVQTLFKDVVRKSPPKIAIATFNRYDGTLDQETFFQLEEAVGYKDHLTKIIPRKIRLIGHLFHSERIHREARPDPTAHCGVDLTPIRSFNLREMREIRWNLRNDIELSSAEFTLKEFEFTADGFRGDRYSTFTEDIKVHPTAAVADGVIYEFEIMGVRNTKLRPVAAFLFPERVSCDPEMTMVFDMHLGEILVSQKVAERNERQN